MTDLANVGDNSVGAGHDEMYRPDPHEEARAEQFERSVRKEAEANFRKLKHEAQAIYGLVVGAPGPRTPTQWAEMIEKAGDEIGNGRFLVRYLGAERYLDPETVAVLLTLRQNLLADLRRGSAADIMMIDTAVISYYNMLRAQRWIGNLCIAVERELFGQEPLNAYHGDTVAQRIETDLKRLAETMLPIQDRASRTMIRALECIRDFTAEPKRRARRRCRAG